jgi:hypothetical protein
MVAIIIVIIMRLITLQGVVEGNNSSRCLLNSHQVGCNTSAVMAAVGLEEAEEEVVVVLRLIRSDTQGAEEEVVVVVIILLVIL